jgi:hypothetical protein
MATTLALEGVRGHVSHDRRWAVAVGVVTSGGGVTAAGGACAGRCRRQLNHVPSTESDAWAISAVEGPPCSDPRFYGLSAARESDQIRHPPPAGKTLRTDRRRIKHQLLARGL